MRRVVGDLSESQANQINQFAESSIFTPKKGNFLSLRLWMIFPIKRRNARELYSGDTLGDILQLPSRQQVVSGSSEVRINAKRTHRRNLRGDRM